MKINKLRWKRFLFWLIPLTTLLTVSYFFKVYYDENWHVISIEFEDSDLIEAQKTQIRYKGVLIGTVQEITLNQSGEKVIVDCVLSKSARKYAREGSHFEIVQPQVSFDGVRGLETLTSGTYINLLKVGKGKQQDKFTGINSRDSIFGKSPLRIRLKTPFVRSLGRGDALYYRGLKIGEISRVFLNNHRDSVAIDVEMYKNYRTLIRKNSQFWPMSAIHADIGLLGGQVKVSSLESFIKGGIEMAIPPSLEPAAPHGSEFPLLDGPPKGVEEWNLKIPSD